MAKYMQFSREQKKIILAKTNNKCAHCGRKLDAYSMTVDHVFPVSKGGLHDEYNLLALCTDCNEAKSNSVYDVKEFHKYIVDAEKEKFSYYNNFASFDYTHNTILGYDETLFHKMPPKHQMIIDEMQNRGASKKKVKEMFNKLMVSLVLRKAYPANADDIFDFMCRSKQEHNVEHYLYPSVYHVLDDIEEGAVYILENNHKICGVFIFKNAEPFKEDINFNQLNAIAESFNLSIRYVMTYAATDVFAFSMFNNIMSYFEISQIEKGMFPLFFSLLKSIYPGHDKCFSIPFIYKEENREMKDYAVDLEFMSAKHLRERFRHYSYGHFHQMGYMEVSDSDVDTFADLNLRSSYLKDFDDDPVALDFFKQYPKMKDYFKPETFELYDVGFINS